MPVGGKGFALVRRLTPARWRGDNPLVKQKPNEAGAAVVADLLFGSAGGATSHDAAGALASSGAAVAGAAARTRQHDATGALAGAAAAVAGAAARSSGAVTHSADGALAAGGAAIAGSAARTRGHDASGAPAGSGAQIAGAAARTGAAVSHDASGALSGGGSQMAGAASNDTAAPPVQRGRGAGSARVRVELPPPMLDPRDNLDAEERDMQDTQAFLMAMFSMNKVFS